QSPGGFRRVLRRPERTRPPSPGSSRPCRPRARLTPGHRSLAAGRRTRPRAKPDDEHRTRKKGAPGMLLTLTCVLAIGALALWAVKRRRSLAATEEWLA